ncbi:(2Fe-2S)-binding protein [Haloferula sargassicola]|uniref:Isoquinoline 1-oxidoreductase subunit alpha n=1 Tax=Haloferula sargassicola TaxID=490096 RepID=A0ABP9UH78_9BACT
MSLFQLTVNGQAREAEVDDDTPLLWVLRDSLGLCGTKYGCGIGQCGACTIHLDGQPVRSCTLPVSAGVGHEITTIEGLAEDDQLTPLQQAWCDLDVAQCGYCQSGQIMTAAALLKNTPEPDADAIDQAMAGNVCRCATYDRIRKAILTAAGR